MLQNPSTFEQGREALFSSLFFIVQLKNGWGEDND
jgi:hypothetical protein